MTHLAPDAAQFAALARLMRLASNDTPQARCAADFLLAWSGPPDGPGFDLTSLWGLAPAQVADMLTAIAYFARADHGLEPLGLGEDLRRIRQQWSR